jgi:transcriptional regulator with XRE-family HTH domain
MNSGETLRLIRTLKGIKQNTIAKKIGISQPAYCKLEQQVYIREDKLLKLLISLDSDKEEMEKVKTMALSNKA